LLRKERGDLALPLKKKKRNILCAEHNTYRNSEHLKVVIYSIINMTILYTYNTNFLGIIE